MKKIKEFIDLKVIIKKFQEEIFDPSIQKNYDPMRASEALFGFAGWVSCMEKPVVASGKHDAAIWAELVGEFCDVNGLEPPRDYWTDFLTMPSTDYIKEGVLLKELMDNPYEWEITDQDPEGFWVEFVTDNDITYEFKASWMEPVLSKEYDKYEYDLDGFEVSFILLRVGDEYGSSFGITDTGDEFRVFATIAKIMDVFIKQYNPTAFTFSAKEKSREKLYDVLSKRIAREYKYSLETFRPMKDQNYIFKKMS